MNHEERILEIELERLEMEKRRDRHASIRFLIGSVLLVLGTSGASIYISAQQGERSLTASERQWVVPMLMEVSNDEHNDRIERIDSLLKLSLSEPTLSYLRAERMATIGEQKKIEAKRKAELEARMVAEAKARAAEAARQREKEAAAKELEAKKLAEQETQRRKAEADAARAKSERLVAEQAAREAAEKAAREKAEQEALVQLLREDRLRRLNVY